MDNLSCHRTNKVIKLCNKNKINIIFNVIYKSNFDAIELTFRSLKIKIYKKLYESVNSVSDNVKRILNEKEFSII